MAASNVQPTRIVSNGYPTDTSLIRNSIHIIPKSIPPNMLSHKPVNIKCPSCHATIMTRVDYRIDATTWIACGVLCFLGAWCGCQFIPFCKKTYKDAVHECPNCNSTLGVHKPVF